MMGDIWFKLVGSYSCDTHANNLSYQLCCSSDGHFCTFDVVSDAAKMLKKKYFGGGACFLLNSFSCC